MITFLSQEDNKYIKIGWSKHSPITNYDIISGYNPYKLYFMKITNGDRYKKQEIQYKFKHLQIHHDWFRGEQELLDFINQLPDDEHSKYLYTHYKYGK